MMVMMMMMIPTWGRLRVRIPGLITSTTIITIIITITTGDVSVSW
jgi:hypothetical protein